MKSPSHVRSGSALLIVLGMTAFMLFSGLAFSVYMRYSRLPTSFLRRTTTTHQLARAAVAEAIEAIDKAIGDDPHPGVRASGGTTTANYWYDRVFFGEERTSDPAYDSDTVATLTLEGLAYLPPNMINDMRYYSRCTPTAKWRSFWFDSGRYAYTAIDVSDYFDVNRLIADRGRAACASRRISLAHLFEAGGVQHSGAGKGAEDWDKMIEGEGVRTVDAKTGEITFEEPFVSLADFNIAWNNKGQKGVTFGAEAVQNPFGRMVGSGGDGTPYGGNLNSTDPKCEYYKNLTFVTESWTPSDSLGKTPNGETEVVDLAAEQPFLLSDLEKKNPSLDQDVIRYTKTILTQASPAQGKEKPKANLCNNLSRLGLALLWDYLDPNSVPLSLAIPTLERTPMIVGVQPTLPNIKIEKGAKTDSDVSVSGKTRVRRREQKYTLKVASQNVAVRVLAAYPFRSHGLDIQDDSFQLDGRLAIFFTVDGQNMSLRPGDANEALQLKKDNLKTGGFLNDSVMSIPLTEQSVTATDIAKNESQPVKAVSLTGKVSDLTSGVDFMTVVYQWTQTQTQTGAWMPENPTEKDIVADGTEFAFCPLNATGDKVKAPENFVAGLQNGTGAKLKVNAAVWARVSQDDKTVDLVPAHPYDDEELNGVGISRVACNNLEQNDYPLLRYDVKAGGQNDAIDLSVSALDASPTYQLTIDNPRAIVNDPRYNHMPENWYTVSGNGMLGEQDWMNETAKMVGQDGRDNDIFLFTSDQGYLQSVYELAYLPRFGGLTKDTKGDSSVVGNYVSLRNAGAKGRTSLATDYSQTLDANVMWRTYRCYGTDRDDFENIGLVCGATGPLVNPYSDSTNVLMAAFANTPLDWRCSSTNENSLAKSAKDAATFNAKYAWNGYDSNSKARGKLCWEHLQAVAGHLKDGVRYYRDWETAFKNLKWSSDKGYLLEGIELDTTDSDVYGVDKKFLYGFWHDSFSARQQLFLVFVRAEPMMMGGGVAGQAPPQLGARAVALVWRDPNNTLKTQSQQGTQNAGVHRTRILFYHQFD